MTITLKLGDAGLGILGQSLVSQAVAAIVGSCVLTPGVLLAGGAIGLIAGAAFRQLIGDQSHDAI